MLLWHMGLAAAITYVALGRRRIDYRFVLLGAVLPDAVDALIGAFAYADGVGRYHAHTLLAPLVVATLVVVAFRGERRLAVFGVAVGWALHLVGDGMWAAPTTFYWPVFGTEFATEPVEPYSWDLLSRPWAHWSTWAAELVGAAILAWFWVAFELGRDDRARLFAKDGYLRP